MSGVLDLYGLASFFKKKIKIKIHQDLSRYIKIMIKNTAAEDQKLGAQRERNRKVNAQRKRNRFVKSSLNKCIL